MKAEGDVMPGSEEVIHPLYLPFTREQLSKHFAGDPDQHVAYYWNSGQRATAHAATAPGGTSAEMWRATVSGRQVEKDERFWVAGALMRVFDRPDRAHYLAQILRRCLGDRPAIAGVDTWEAALGDEQHLFFEASLPSPKGYKDFLAQQLSDRVLVPYLREAADRPRTRLEGSTKVDALLIAPQTEFAVVFEAKVLSDISGGVRFDVLRNQIARNIDAMLESNRELKGPRSLRNPARTCFVLITPEIFREHPESRLYGWLLRAYQERPDLLQDHLAHRDDVDFSAVSRRLGWLTWEDINKTLPGTCPWLIPTNDRKS
jgi:hypothetical protein